MELVVFEDLDGFEPLFEFGGGLRPRTCRK